MGCFRILEFSLRYACMVIPYLRPPIWDPDPDSEATVAAEWVRLFRLSVSVSVSVSLFLSLSLSLTLSHSLSVAHSCSSMGSGHRNCPAFLFVDHFLSDSSPRCYLRVDPSASFAEPDRGS